jgi:hypothetical protein
VVARVQGLLVVTVAALLAGLLIPTVRPIDASAASVVLPGNQTGPQWFSSFYVWSGDVTRYAGTIEVRFKLAIDRGTADGGTARFMWGCNTRNGQRGVTSYPPHWTAGVYKSVSVADGYAAAGILLDADATRCSFQVWGEDGTSIKVNEATFHATLDDAPPDPGDPTPGPTPTPTPTPASCAEEPRPVGSGPTPTPGPGCTPWGSTSDADGLGGVVMLHTWIGVPGSGSEDQAENWPATVTIPGIVVKAGWTYTETATIVMVNETRMGIGCDWTMTRWNGTTYSTASGSHDVTDPANNLAGDVGECSQSAVTTSWTVPSDVAGLQNWRLLATNSHTTITGGGTTAHSDEYWTYTWTATDSPDTDGDGVKDHVEVGSGSDPNNASSTPTPAPTPTPTPTGAPPVNETIPPNEPGPGEPQGADMCEGPDDRRLMVCQEGGSGDVDGDGNGDGNGAPGGGGTGSSGVAGCPTTPVEDKIGYVEYEEVTELDSLAPAIEGKQGLDIIGAAIGWLGAVVGSIPERFSNAFVWVWNQGINAVIPGDCIDQIFESFMADTLALPPFSWVVEGVATIEESFSYTGSPSFPTWNVGAGVTLSVGDTIAPVAALMAPYRGILGAAAYFFMVGYAVNLVASVVGHRAQPRQLTFGFD